MNNSKLELIIGPMFSQKCLNPDFKVFTFDGKIKEIKELEKDDLLISPTGKPVSVLSTTRGYSTMYQLKNAYTSFQATPNHILVFKIRVDYYYRKITFKRGIFYFINKKGKLDFFPVLEEDKEKELEILKNQKNIMLSNSIIEMTVEEYAKNTFYKSILAPFKEIVNFKKRPVQNIIYSSDIPESILFNDYKIRLFFLKFVLTHPFNKKAVQIKENNIIIDLRYFNYVFKTKLIFIIKTLKINWHIEEKNYLFIYDFDIEKFLKYSVFDVRNETFTEKDVLHVSRILERKPFVGFELENDGKFLSCDSYVMHNSTFLLNIVRKYSNIDKNIMVYSHSLDATRYSKYYLTTHDKQQMPCKFISSLNTLKDDKEYRNADIIVIEESQFFEDLNDFVIEQLDTTNKHFIICGLSGDTQRKPFGKLLDLIPHADKIHKLESFCSECNDGTPAIYTQRKVVDNKEQILIGSKEYYQPVCRKHYKKVDYNT